MEYDKESELNNIMACLNRDLSLIKQNKNISLSYKLNKTVKTYFKLKFGFDNIYFRVKKPLFLEHTIRLCRIIYE